MKIDLAKSFNVNGCIQEMEREELLNLVQHVATYQEAVLSSLGAGVCICDSQGKITDVNQAFVEIFGVSENELASVSLGISDVLRIETWGGSPILPEETLLARALKGEIVKNNKLRLNRNEEVKWLLGSSAPISANDGRFIGAVVTFIDISKGKVAENNYHRQNNILKAINQIYKEAFKSETIEELGKICLNIVESITESKFSFIGEIGPDGLSHDIAVSDPGWELCRMFDKTGHRIKLDTHRIHGITGRVLLDGKSLLTNDPPSHPDSIGVPDGHPRLTAFLGVPFVRDGKVVGMIGVANREGGYRSEDQEILEALTPTILQILLRKRAEDAKRESEEKYRAFFENSIDAVFITAPEGGIEAANSAACRMFGMTEAELIQGGRNAVIDLTDSRHESAKEIRAKTGRFMGELNQRRKDGTVFPGEVSTAFFIDRNGHTKTVMILRDITKRKKAEEALRENEARQVYLLKLSDAIRMLSDTNSIIDAATNLLVEHLGVSQASYSEYSDENGFVRNENPGVDAQSPKMVQMLSEFPVTMAIVRSGRNRVVADLGSCAELPAEERTRWLALNYRAVIFVPLIKEGKFFATLSVKQSTPREWTPTEVELVSETAERIWGALERARADEALLRADRQKDEFLAILSHELRNPLAAIRNSLSILDRAAPEGAQAKRARDIINRQVGQLSHLVDDLLDVTRITQKKIVLKREREEINELVRRTVEDYRPLFEKNGVHLEMELSPVEIFVEGDDTRLAQVVGNLLQNAAKFTVDGDCAKISTERDSVQLQAIIRVIDTGIGIAPEMLPRLFEPFWQADTSLDRSRSGLGLGLPLSKGLIELHNGNITVQSEGLGKGSKFVVCLPLDETAEGIKSALPQEVQHYPRHVLIIDDNIDLARSLYELLELCEHEVAVAYDGYEGLKRAREFKPEVVLCDIGLPGMDGYEVARAFREDAELKDITLVALTGYAQSADQLKATQAGFEAHLAKPVELDALERLLSDLPKTIKNN